MNRPAQIARVRLDEMRLALALLTRLPVGRIADPVPSFAAAYWAFPLAGLCVGTIAALTLLGAFAAGLPPVIAAGLALAAGVVVTGALHEDGLADTADGFGGGKDRDHKLAIMRDSRIGSFGTLALMLTLGLRWSAVATLCNQDVRDAATALVAIAIASRAGLPVILALLSPARSDGLGHAASSGTAARALAAVTIGSASIALLLNTTAALGIVIAVAIALVLMARLTLRQIGGQTGDVLGAVQQIADLCAWLVTLWLAR